MEEKREYPRMRGNPPPTSHAKRRMGQMRRMGPMREEKEENIQCGIDENTHYRGVEKFIIEKILQDSSWLPRVPGKNEYPRTNIQW
jgi:hypothetical protein